MFNLTTGLLIFAIILIAIVPGGGTIGVGVLIAAGVVEYMCQKNQYSGLFFADC